MRFLIVIFISSGLFHRTMHSLDPAALDAQQIYRPLNTVLNLITILSKSSS